MGIIKSINELRWAKKAEETSTGTSLVVVKQQAVTAGVSGAAQEN